MRYELPLKNKEVDEVIGDEMWATAQTIDISCQKCSNTKAYFKEFQTRSADEPMTQFFRCTKCGHEWKEG